MVESRCPSRCRFALTPGPSVRLLVPLVVAVVLTMAGSIAAAQEAGTPAPPVAGRTLLLQAALQELPPRPVALAMNRLTLTPGTTSPVQRRPGPELDLIEAGALVVRVDGPAVILPGDDRDRFVAPTGQDIPLTAGDRIAYAADTPQTVSNAADEPAIVLSITLLPGGDDTSATNGTPATVPANGITATLLGQATVSDPPAGVVAVTLERFELVPGGRLTAYPGPSLVAIEEGSISGTVVEGAVEVAQAGASEAAPAAAGAAFTVGAGQALFFPGGMSETDDLGGSGQVTLLRLGLLDLPDEVATAPAGTPGASGRLEAGATVVVTANDVRLRAGPSASEPVLAGLRQGQLLQVTGPPAEADGIRWVPVTDPANPDLRGYVAADFLDLQEE